MLYIIVDQDGEITHSLHFYDAIASLEKTTLEFNSEGTYLKNEPKVTDATFKCEPLLNFNDYINLSEKFGLECTLTLSNGDNVEIKYAGQAEYDGLDD